MNHKDRTSTRDALQLSAKRAANLNKRVDLADAWAAQFGGPEDSDDEHALWRWRDAAVVHDGKAHAVGIYQHASQCLCNQ